MLVSDPLEANGYGLNILCFKNNLESPINVPPPIPVHQYATWSPL